LSVIDVAFSRLFSCCSFFGFVFLFFCYFIEIWKLLKSQ
jgi:hypothetical protein